MLTWSGFLILERCWFSLVFNSRDVNASRVRWSDLISLERCWFSLVFNSRDVYVSRVTIHLSSLDDISRVRPYISRVIFLRPSSDTLSDLMKVLNHISIKTIILFPHLPIGAGGSRVCRASWSLERRFVWFDPSRDALSGSITRVIHYLIWWKC